jgi:antitoxin ParD1/3/4
MSSPKSPKGFVVNEYFQNLVRQDQERQAYAKLETMLLEGEDSGDGSEVTAEFWQGLKAEILEQGNSSPVA